MSHLSLRALAAASLVLTLAACDSTGPSSPVVPEAPPVVATSPVALPLAVGNEWTYREIETRLEQDGVTVRSVDTLQTPATLRVTEAVDIGGETWYRLVGTRTLRVAFGSFLYTNRADGLYSRSDSPTGRATRQVAFPAQAGARYGISYWHGTIDSPEGVAFDSDVTLKVTDLPAQVGADAYEGFLYTVATQRIRLSGLSFEMDARSRPLHWLVVPNVGYAQYEIGYVGVSHDNVARYGGLYRYSLQSFTLAQLAE